VSPAGRAEGVDGLVCEKDRVTGGLGELLDAGCDVDGVTDQGELELSCAADGSGDHQTGVDPDLDRQLAAEALVNEAMINYRDGHCSLGVIHQVVRRAEDGQRAIGEELVDMTTRVDNGRHAISNSALRRATVSSAEFASTNGLKSRTSTNITVTSRRSPVKASSPCSSSRAARAWST
jgi:hypothetical protein